MEFKRIFKAALSNSFNKYIPPILNNLLGPGSFDIIGGGWGRRLILGEGINQTFPLGPPNPED